VGYSKLKDFVRRFFWSGSSFDEEGLTPGTGKFKDAARRYTSASEIDLDDLGRWLGKAREIQWDYKNLRKNGGLERIR